jgi:hypothetical protein
MATISDWLNDGYTPAMVTEAVKEICSSPNAPAISRPGSIDWKLRDLKVKKANGARVEDDPYKNFRDYDKDPVPEIKAVPNPRRRVIA